ncbi:MAG: YlbF family regulator [Oscillospiraceae bacterium]|jgi:cell fate (sporulation/competence/biofilm development) regulator YlbF (YheA/YmcA/DUF963 family)|nr:YlbF family regulator [Oscillospiraceae bacterium]
MSDIIKLARDLGKAIQEQPSFIRLQIARTANDEDESLQDKIGEFNLKRMAVNQEGSQESPDEEKLGKLNEELVEIYQGIMENPHMQEYNNAKTELDVQLGHVNAILNGSFNGEDPETIELSSCSASGCSGCSGCQ